MKHKTVYEAPVTESVVIRTEKTILDVSVSTGSATIETMRVDSEELDW